MLKFLKKNGPLLFLTAYILIVLYITLFSRSFSLVHVCKPELFWSYVAWYRGNGGMNGQILFNIALFVPLGYFLFGVLQGRNCKRAGLFSVGIGFCFSVTIEAVQYFGRLGTCDVDDVINNVLGVCIGVGVYQLLTCFSGTSWLKWGRLVLSVLFLMAGAVGCRATYDSVPYMAMLSWAGIVSVTAPEPEVTGTDLTKMVRQGVLKAHDSDHDVYVFQFDRKLYWLIGTPIDKRTEIIFHLHTNEPDKLPEHRKKFKFDNRGFRAGGKNELTGVMRCGKYRVFEQSIPNEYNITVVWVGFNTNKKITWSRWFRVKRE